MDDEDRGKVDSPGDVGVEAENTWEISPLRRFPWRLSRSRQACSLKIAVGFSTVMSIAEEVVGMFKAEDVDKVEEKELTFSSLPFHLPSPVAGTF